LPTPQEATQAQRVLAWALIIVIYFAIVAAHQLTPYMALASIAALVLFGLLWRGWLMLLVLAAIAVGYLVPRYGLISQQFGGLFSGGNVLKNASGVTGISRYGAELFTSKIVRALDVGMWLFALAAIARQWRTLGRVVTPALLAFSPFLSLFAQRYGGEVIYRVYMFSAPWCALLIAGALVKLRVATWRWLAVTCACSAAIAAGLQGLYGPVAVYDFTPAELTASLWLYGHAPHGSLLVLAADNFPILEVADYNSYDLQVIPADPQENASWINEANIPEIERWITSLGHRTAYVVLSRSMVAYASYFGSPKGYLQMANAVRYERGWSVIYRNADTTIYRVEINKHST
jgi:hypothetical protein